MIIDCCGLYRSGTTLIYNLLREILNEYKIGTTQWPDSLIAHQRHVDPKTYYLIKIHDFEERFEFGDWANDFYFVHSYRDIRDIVVSLCEWRHLVLDNFDFQDKNVDLFIDWMVRLDGKWKSKKNVLVLRYEDYYPFYSFDIQRLVKILLNHFGWIENEELINRLATKYCYPIIKEYSDKLIVTDNERMLNVKHVGNAKIGKWKTYFTEKEKEKFFNKNEALQAWLTKNDYE